MTRTEQEISSGAVIFKKDQDKIQIILYSRKNSTQWCLPKGKMENGETPEMTALREVQEETGLRGKILSFLDDVHYAYDDKKRNMHFIKTVHYFLMRYVSGQISTADTGVESVQWLDIDDAQKMVTFENERQIIKSAKNKLLNKDTAC